MEKYSGIKVSWVANKDNDRLYEELVPDSGKADTVEGEMLRAINRIMYRHSNDGDYFYEDYGIETAGSSFIYLTRYSPLKNEMKMILEKAIDLAPSAGRDGQYEMILNKALVKIIKFILDKQGKYEKNTNDSISYGQEAKEEFGNEDEEDEYE